MYETLSKAKADMTHNKPNNAWDWHAKIIKFGRVNCVIAVEEDTRYAIFLCDLKKADFKMFHYAFMDQFENHIVDLFGDTSVETQKIIFDLVLRLRGSCSYSKPMSNSVISHMTQMQYEIEDFCHRDLGGYLPATNHHLLSLGHRLNDNIRTHKNIKTECIVPIREFKAKILSMLNID
ncbi:MAG: hypothetical protein AB7E76_08055 [Deferribacterales bacterium]